MAAPEILDRRTVHKGYLTVEALHLRLADGSEATREVESHGDGGAVLPYDAGRRVALTVSLMRPPVLDAAGLPELEEACAGMIESGDDAAETARREAGEEMGVELTQLESVGTVWSSPGVSTERVTLFLAPYSQADRKGAGGGAEGEQEGITVREPSLGELAARAETGLIADAKLLTLVQTLRLKRPELFVSRATSRT